MHGLQLRGIDSVLHPERPLDVVGYLCNDALFVAELPTVAGGDGDDEGAGDGDGGTAKVAELSELGAEEMAMTRIAGGKLLRYKADVVLRDSEEHDFSVKLNGDGIEESLQLQLHTPAWDDDKHDDESDDDEEEERVISHVSRTGMESIEFEVEASRGRRRRLELEQPRLCERGGAAAEPLCAARAVCRDVCRRWRGHVRRRLVCHARPVLGCGARRAEPVAVGHAVCVRARLNAWRWRCSYQPMTPTSICP